MSVAIVSSYRPFILYEMLIIAHVLESTFVKGKRILYNIQIGDGDERDEVM